MRPYTSYKVLNREFSILKHLQKLILKDFSTLKQASIKLKR